MNAANLMNMLDQEIDADEQLHQSIRSRTSFEEFANQENNINRENSGH